MKPMFIIVKGEAHQMETTEEQARQDEPIAERPILPYEAEANAFMNDGYRAYVEEHGYHFTDKLAEHVSRMMVNADGTSHSWTAEEVRQAISNIGLNIPDEVTLGDMTFLANMYYADFYPDPLAVELACLRAAYRVAADPDGYRGITFCRWTADAIGKSIEIDWEEMM